MEFAWIKQKLLLRDLIPKLEAHPNVLQVKKESQHLVVRFDTGAIEYWILTKDSTKSKCTYLLPMDRDFFNDYEIRSFKQFESNPLYPEESALLKDHFIIKPQDFKKAGWCDVRFKVHDLAVELVDEGYIPPKYSEELLRKDWEALKNANVSRHRSSLVRFLAFDSLSLGRRLILHFMPCAAKAMWKFYPLYKAIDQSLANGVTREGIVYRLAKSEHVIRHPSFCRSIFQEHLNIKGKSIYDLCPDWGFKALGIIADDGEYYCDSPFIDNLKQMADFVGGKIDSPTLSHYDLIMLSDIYPVNLMRVHHLIGKYKSSANHLMIAVRKEDRQELMDRYKPWRMLRIQDGVVNRPRQDNYLMIIDTKLTKSAKIKKL